MDIDWGRPRLPVTVGPTMITIVEKGLANRIIYIIPVGISSMESDHLGTENDHFIITISLYTTESLRGPDSKTNSVLASFVREFDVLELGCQII